MVKKDFMRERLHILLAALVFCLFSCLLISSSSHSQDISPAPSGTFSVVAIPDTQAYSAKNPDIFYAETGWIADNLDVQRIAFVSHVGDVVDSNIPSEWGIGLQAMNLLDGKVPYGVSVGNHDMDCSAGDASLFSRYFPAKRFINRKWYGGHFKDNVNSFQLFKAQGLNFVILHLECNAPDDVLGWADGVLEKHKDRRAIVCTHMFLGPIREPETKEDWFTGPKGIMEWSKCHSRVGSMWSRKVNRGNTPQQLWDKCFKKHRNIFLILCGDQSRTQAMSLVLMGTNGNKVYACLSDYRDGFIRVYRFVPGRNRIEVMTYSVIRNELCEGTEIAPDESDHQFVLPYDMSAQGTGGRYE